MEAARIISSNGNKSCICWNWFLKCFAFLVKNSSTFLVSLPFFTLSLNFLNHFVLQRVVQEAAVQVMTGDLPLTQPPMALLAVVVLWDLDPMVTVDIIVILHKMVTWTLVQTPAAVAHLIDYLLLHQVLRVTNINRWLIGEWWPLYNSCFDTSLEGETVLPLHFIHLRIRSSQFFVSARIFRWWEMIVYIEDYSLLVYVSGLLSISGSNGIKVDLNTLIMFLLFNILFFL